MKWYNSLGITLLVCIGVIIILQALQWFFVPTVIIGGISIVWLAIHSIANNDGTNTENIL